MTKVQIAVVFSTVFYLLGCAAAVDVGTQSTTSDRTVSEIRELVMQADFSAAITPDQFWTFDTPGSELNGFGRVYLGQVEARVTGDLTEADKQRMGMWVPESGPKAFIDTTIYWINQHYLENGTLPVTGADMFPKLLTESGYQEFLNMSVADRLGEYASGIDPITGKFYQSFAADQWAAGCLNVEIISDPRQIEALYPGKTLYLGGYTVSTGQTMEARTAPVELVVTTTVYGEEPGSVIANWTSFKAN